MSSNAALRGPFSSSTQASQAESLSAASGTASAGIPVPFLAGDRGTTIARHPGSVKRPTPSCRRHASTPCAAPQELDDPAPERRVAEADREEPEAHERRPVGTPGAGEEADSADAPDDVRKADGLRATHARVSGRNGEALDVARVVGEDVHAVLADRDGVRVAEAADRRVVQTRLDREDHS